MIDLLNRPWIGMPIFYALTVVGLIAGFRRAGVPLQGGMFRALFIGLPVMLGVWVLWDVIIGIFEARGGRDQFDGLNLLLGFVFFPCSSALAGVALARHKRTSLVERGTVIIDVRGQQPARPLPGGLTLAGQRVASMDETKHFKIIGTTGTGKSTAIRELLAGALARGDRAVIADPNGDYARDFYDPARGDVILNPFDRRAARWDLFAEIVEPHDADHLARSLIPDYDGQDRNWRGYARTFLTAVLRQLHRVGRHDLTTLYGVLVDATEQDLRDLLEGTPAAPFIGKEGGKFLESVRSIVMQHLAALEHLMRQADGEAFSVRKWIREGRGVLFLPYSGIEIASLRTVISTWMRLGIFETMSLEEGDHRLWFVVDELDALGAIDGLKDALARLRKFGGRCLLGLQSIAQIRGTYGNSDAETITENCGTTVILRCSASERGGTAEFASRLIGQREVTRQQLSHSRPRRLFGFLHQTRTVTDQVTTESAVLASEIEQLPDLSGFLKMPSLPHWYRVNLSSKEPMTDAPKKYASQGILVAILVGVIMAVILLSHLTARLDPPTSARTGLDHVPSVSTIPSNAAATSRKRVVAAKPSNPLEVTLGPSSIGGQFTLLAANRIAATPTTDKLTLRLRVVSRAMPDLVTPLQYVTLEIYMPGVDPIAPEHPFSHPVAAGTTRDEDIAFVVPSNMVLNRSDLRIQLYNEQKYIPLSLLPRGP